MRTTAVFYLNGHRLEVGPMHAKMMLSDYLRYVKGLTGTKVVCAEGDCGACTVLRAFDRPDFLPMNACIVTVAQMDGSSLVTVDALAEGEKLTPVQSAMMTCHGSQCGFCTPGFVMALTGLVEKKLCSEPARRSVSDRDAKNALTGNLCRCTGYKPILEAAASVDLLKCESLERRFWSRKLQLDLAKVRSEPLLLEDETFRFYAPTTLRQAAKALAVKSDAKVVAAATDLGVTHNKWRERIRHVVSLHLISELYELKRSRGRISVGARVTLGELRNATLEILPELAKFLDIFASPQIKNVATLIGNVANASPIADTPPFLLVSDAVVETFGPRGERSVPISKFFVGYRKTALKKGELIKSISFAIPDKSETLVLRKVSERKDLDISSVNAAFHIAWADTDKTKIKSARVAIGGVAATTLRLKKTEAFLGGQTLDREVIDGAVAVLHDEINPISDVRGSSAFRHVLVENIFRRFFAEVRS